MRMTTFRVQNYRSILDSGWVETGEITTVVGKNESGKTSLLRALWKFHPFTDAPYDLTREWPRGRRRAMADDQPVVTVRFAFTPAEQQQLGAIDPVLGSLLGVEAQRNYRGDYSYRFLPHTPEIRRGLDRLLALLTARFVPARKSGNAAADPPAAAATQEEMIDIGRLAALTALDESLPHGRQASRPRLTDADTAAPPSAALRRAVALVHNWLPTFIYMDDYKVFKGSAFLRELLERRQAHRLSEEDRTVLKIMEMAGLDLEAEVRHGQAADREQRMLDMNDASLTLTRELAHRWSQKQYEVMFQVDGQHFITFVKDAETSILVPLEERSKGFQWFFSFDMTFMYETQGSFRNAILLLDEPGLHLHAAAQRDMCARLRAYAQQNQLLYTTHLPFMIDLDHVADVYVAEDTGAEGTTVRRHPPVLDPDAQFTLQAAVTLPWYQSLYTGGDLLIVEQLTDYWYLLAFSSLCAAVGIEALDSRLSIIPGCGAGHLAAAGALLDRQQTRAAALLGVDTASALPGWLLDPQRVLQLREIAERPYPCVMEDLFPESFFWEQVAAEYQQELRGSALAPYGEAESSILPRVEAALAALGIAQFDRSRVAHRIIRHLAATPFTELPAGALSQFLRLIRAINNVIRDA